MRPSSVWWTILDARSRIDKIILDDPHGLVYLDVPYRNADPLKQLFFRILTSIPHEGRPRLDGEDGRLSVSHFTDREDRPMPLVQWLPRGRLLLKSSLLA